MYIKKPTANNTIPYNKGKLVLSGSLSCVDFKDIFSPLWNSSCGWVNHIKKNQVMSPTRPCGQKVGLEKERKKTKTKSNNQDLISCVLKFHLHTRLFSSKLQTNEHPKVATSAFMQWPPRAAGTFQSHAVSWALDCF